MKKGRIWLSLVAAFALCLLLVACGGGNEPVQEAQDFTANFAGVWEIASMTEDGEEVSADDIELMKSFGLDVFLVLNEDGSGEINMFGEEIDLNWSAKSATEASITIADADEDASDFEGEVPLTLADDTLTLSQDGDSIVFAKSTQEAMDAMLAAGATGDDASV